MLINRLKESSEQLVTRFAPAPTGFLHLGHVLSALYVWAFSRAIGAKIILRIEDHDQSRSKIQFYDLIPEMLKWLGLFPDIGFHSLSATPLYTQLSNLNRYEEVLKKLTMANRVYRCYCSRKQLNLRRYATNNAVGGDGEVYDGFCDGIASKDDCPFQLRFRTNPLLSLEFHDLIKGKISQNPHEQCGDFPIVDRIKQYTYQLAVVSDDLAQGVNLVIRGEDILESTGRQLSIYDALGLDPPRYYLHHPLLLDKVTGYKLSKSTHSESILSMKTGGYRPEMVIGQTLFQANLIGEARPTSLSEAFSRILVSIESHFRFL